VRQEQIWVHGKQLVHGVRPGAHQHTAGTNRAGDRRVKGGVTNDDYTAGLGHPAGGLQGIQQVPAKGCAVGLMVAIDAELKPLQQAPVAQLDGGRAGKVSGEHALAPTGCTRRMQDIDHSGQHPADRLRCEDFLKAQHIGEPQALAIFEGIRHSIGFEQRPGDKAVGPPGQRNPRSGSMGGDRIGILQGRNQRALAHSRSRQQGAINVPNQDRIQNHPPDHAVTGLHGKRDKARLSFGLPAAGPAAVLKPVERFLQLALAALQAGTFVRLKLRRGEARETWRRVELRGRQHLSGQVLDGPRAVTRNLDLGDPLAALSGVLTPPLRSAFLATTERDWQLEPMADGRWRLHSMPPGQREVPPGEHDRRQERLLDPAQQPWLAALGLATAEGKLRASAQDKWRQICHYVEQVDARIRQLPEASLPQAGRPWRVVDMAAGKGYLTFGLHAYLTQVRGWSVSTVGVERRDDLARAGNAHAAAAGWAPAGDPDDLATPGLRFVAGEIDRAGLPGTTADVVTALHACDTATDDALLAGMRAGAALILAAPCCQREVRALLRRPPLLEGLLRHGIHEDRFAEMLTDAVRALVLETRGYRVQVAEWVGAEHTPRNTLISAIRTGESRPGAAAELASLIETFDLGAMRLLRD